MIVARTTALGRPAGQPTEPVRREMRCRKTIWSSSCSTRSRSSISDALPSVLRRETARPTAFRCHHDGHAAGLRLLRGVCSSRKIAAACERNLAFRAIVGDDPPDFRTISDFRKIHLAAFRPLFLEVLRWPARWAWSSSATCPPTARRWANASRHKAMSYGYMNKDIERLEAEIEQLLKQAEQLDAEQDAALGSRRGDELPDELKRREDRLAKIREAKERLEAEARARRKRNNNAATRNKPSVKPKAASVGAKNPPRSMRRPKTRRRRTSPIPKRRS